MTAPSLEVEVEYGAIPFAGATQFSVWAPLARQLSVRVHTGAAAGEHPLVRDKFGVFRATIDGVVAGDDYAFRIDAGDERPDPASRWQPHGVHGPSRVVDPHAFSWTDGAWKGIEMPDYVIYELHVGTFTPEGTFDAIVPRLASLRELGVTAIELMPVAQFPGERNWGYDGVQLYAPQNSYGGPDGLRRLVNAAHAEGLAVVLDVVYNHVGPEGNYLSEYGPYFTNVYRTPWGPAVNYDGPYSDEVRRFIIENACYWVREFHIDALRLDAVHGIYDFRAVHLTEALTERVHELADALGRHVHVIAESDLNDPRLLRSVELGGYGMDAQWSDDFHHAMHVALTGERVGYYEGFAEHGDIQAVQDALQLRFVFRGQYASHRHRRHGAPADDISAEHFVVFLQNHDQVGNRATGERLGALVSPDALKLAAALLLLSPYVPLLFMGEEYNEPAPFQYFVSHSDRDLVAAVRKGRHEEFESFGWAGEVPDPQAEETYERSRIHYELGSEGEHAALREMYRELLSIRREEPALRPGAARVTVGSSSEARWVVMRLDAPGARSLLALFNFSNVEASIPLRHDSGDWKQRFATRPGVSSGNTLQNGEGGVLFVNLPPVSAALFSLDV
ncbi:MAG TPA: malto-oligosyltrehalose trehalohydrolase [Gemmatimonadaceae bacterium]|nr:malto-oligosyltrehalose trehalohydrolase [Gemmatimonadaceae bacterium]